MILISNINLEVFDGSTIASTTIYGEDKKTYINIGSGNVFKLRWNTPILTNDTVDHYDLVIKRHDTTLNVYYDIFDKNIGLINEFYVDSALLPTIPLQYKLSIYIVAYGKNSSVITSNVATPYICKGSGAYVKPDEYESYPIMKRAVAFAKVASSDMSAAMSPLGSMVALATVDGEILLESEKKVLITSDVVTYKANLVDREGRTLFGDKVSNVKLLASATKLLNSINGWEVMQESYTKANGEWHINDIKYEMLVDENGPIEVKDANGDYVPLYVL